MFSTLSDVQLLVSNSTFSENLADNGYGGAIYNARVTTNGTVPTSSLGNSTFSGNHATVGVGGALFNDASNGVLNLGSSIVTGNTADFGPNIQGHIVSLGTNLIGNPSGVPTSDFVTGTMADQTSVTLTSMALGGLAGNGGPTSTMALIGTGNPAVGKGVCAWPSTAPFPAVTTDQRGNSRSMPCDVGAFETTKAVSSPGGSCSMSRPGKRADDPGAAVLALLALSSVLARRTRQKPTPYRGQRPTAALGTFQDAGARGRRTRRRSTCSSINHFLTGSSQRPSFMSKRSPSQPTNCPCWEGSTDVPGGLRTREPAYQSSPSG